MTITIYTKPGCPFCATARDDLMDRGAPFDEIDVTTVADAKAELAQLTGGRMVVPVIVEEDGTVKVAPGGG